MYKLLIVSMISTAAFASNEPIYLNQSGKTVSAADAIMSSAHGELVYKCVPQEFKVSKSGNSISIKGKKKSLTKEQIAEQIKELQKRAE